MGETAKLNMFVSSSLDREFIFNSIVTFTVNTQQTDIVYQVYYFSLIRKNTPVNMILTLFKHEAPCFERK